MGAGVDFAPDPKDPPAQDGAALTGGHRPAAIRHFAGLMPHRVAAVLNAAAPRPVTMLALPCSLEAIGGAPGSFAWRPAPPSAIEAVVLDTGWPQSIDTQPDYAGLPDHS
jgi:hypothetical protein